MDVLPMRGYPNPRTDSMPPLRASGMQILCLLVLNPGGRVRREGGGMHVTETSLKPACTESAIQIELLPPCLRAVAATKYPIVYEIRSRPPTLLLIEQKEKEKKKIIGKSPANQPFAFSLL